MCYWLLLRDLQINQESYPFDWCITTPLVIEDCLKTEFKHFTKFGDYSDINDFGMKDLIKSEQERCIYENRIKPKYNYYNMIFGHFLNLNEVKLTEKFNRKINRFLKLINESNKNILFIYTEEANFFNKKLVEQKKKFYDSIFRISNILKKKNINFKILTITINNKIEETEYIKNHCIEYKDTSFYVDRLAPNLNVETKYFINYRSMVKNIVLKYL